MNLDPCLTPYIKINPEWAKDLLIRAKIIKYLEESVDTNLCDLGLRDNFLDMTWRAETTRGKIKLDFIKI